MISVPLGGVLGSVGGDGSGDVQAVLLAADPTATATQAPQGILGTFGGELFVHLTDQADTQWLNLTALASSRAIVTLIHDPTDIPPATNYPPSTVGVFAGATYLKVRADNVAMSGTAETSWVAFADLSQILNDVIHSSYGAGYNGVGGVLHTLVHDANYFQTPGYTGGVLGTFLAALYTRSTLGASYTARTTVPFTTFKAFTGSNSAHVRLTGLLPANARPVRARLLLRTPFAGVGTAQFSLGSTIGEPNARMVVSFNAKGAAGSQGTVGLGDPYDQDPAAIDLDLSTDTAMNNLTAGEVAVQVDYVLE